MRVGLVLAVAVAVLLLEPVAHACSGSDCVPAIALPGDDTVMPVNVAGVRWYAGSGEVADVVLRDVEADLALPFVFVQSGSMFDLRPADPLDPGKTYRFEFPEGSCNPAFNHTFITAPAVELATSNLGTLVLAEPEHGQVEVPESVTCSAYVDAVSVRVEIELDPQVEPFAALLLYETFVDGEPWRHIPRFFAGPYRGRSWVGRGVDKVFATCPGGSSDGLSPGSHQIQMRAEIPGLPEVTLESDVVEFTLECLAEGETGDEDDNGGESGSFIVPADPPDDEQGCGCSTDAGRSAAVSAAPLVLLLACRRRRRTSCSPAC